MKASFEVKWLSVCLLAVVGLCAKAQDGANSKPDTDRPKMNSRQRFQLLTFTTPAYQKEALRLIIGEANQVAQELNLAEQMPITESDLVKAYISPPRMAQGTKSIGNITTSNYTYYVSVGDKFSYLTQRNPGSAYADSQAHYLWPMSRLDTNAAYQLATQFLRAASMDIAALNRDCAVKIDSLTPEGKGGEHFVPVYWIYWMARGGKGLGPAAEVELFLPTKTIRQLRVNSSEYILRKPLQITNLDFLLSQTNTPTKSGP